MKPKPPKADKEIEFVCGKTRPPSAPLDTSASESFSEVQPPGFKDHPRSSIEAAAVDPDVDDSIGGE